MHWLNEPARWSENGGVLTATADSGSDFWRTTSYGFIRDNGHLYGGQVDGDLDLTLVVRGAYASQYDQAGAMIRVDERHWLKTGVEFYEGRMRMSTVITNDHSSWAIADLPDGTAELRLHLSRRGDAVEIRYAADDGELALASLVYLPSGVPVLAGAMCAAPDGPGFEVAFRDITLTAG